MHIISKQHHNAGRNKNHPCFFHIPQKRSGARHERPEIKNAFSLREEIFSLFARIHDAPSLVFYYTLNLIMTEKQIRAQITDRKGIPIADMKQTFLEALSVFSGRRSIMIVPPDITRLHSMAGTLTCWAVEFFGSRIKTIMPALGTHTPMSAAELDLMFPGVDHSLFAVHDWRRDVETLGIVPAAFIEELSEGRCSWDWEAQVNREIASGRHDLILSIGQVVPHEVIGMANYSKNIFIGTGGIGGINKSHYLGAVYGMERLMGRTDSPVRAVLDYAQEHFAARLPIEYVLTVMKNGEQGPVPAGLFMGADRGCFEAASELSAELNISRLETSPKTVVVYLDPSEYRSTWLGNKSIYRTRMAIADGGKLIILAPGIRSFGEDDGIDGIIRRFGYRGTEAITKEVDAGGILSENLAAAAHLIHGSAEGRFSITCCPGHLSREEVESVGYQYGNLEAMSAFYLRPSLQEGWNRDPEGGSFYYITNPAAGLWIGPDRRIIT